MDILDQQELSDTNLRAFWKVFGKISWVNWGKQYFVVATCSPLEDATNAFVEYNSEAYADGRYPENTIATFSCEEEFLLHGVETLVCGSSNNWDGQFSICNKMGDYIMRISRVISGPVLLGVVGSRILATSTPRVGASDSDYVILRRAGISFSVFCMVFLVLPNDLSLTSSMHVGCLVTNKTTTVLCVLQCQTDR